MKLNKINKKSKFKNTKLFKGITIGTCAVIMGSSLSACSPSEETVKQMIPNDMSFEEALDLVSDKTNMDEILNETKYIELLNNYKIARKNKNINEVTNSLKALGNTIINASIADTLIESDIIDSYDNIISIEIEYNPIINEFGAKEKDQYVATITYTNHDSKIVNGNIEVNDNYISKDYLLEGELFDIVYDLDNCDPSSINLDYTDEIFETLEAYLFTTGKLNDGWFGYNSNKYDGVIKNKYDNEKVKLLKK